MSKALDLDAILARANAATPGPWFVSIVRPREVCHRPPPFTGNDYDGPQTQCPEPIAITEQRERVSRLPFAEEITSPPDALFIAAARSDVPDLVAAVRDRDAEIAALTARLAMVYRFNDGPAAITRIADDRWRVDVNGAQVDRVGDTFESADAAFAALDAYCARTTEKA